MKQNNLDYIPFVYVVINKTTNKKYYGSKYALGCHPSCLWTTYFTSSKTVHYLIEQYGKEDWDVKILKEFPNNPKGAIEYELKLLKESRNDPNCINMCRSVGFNTLEMASKAGKIAHLRAKARNQLLGWGALIKKDPEKFRKIAAKGGKIGSKVQIECKIGIHGYSMEEKREKMLLARKIQDKKNRNAFRDPKKQSENGKKGGPKNKGFRWYNDGVKSYKYTKKQQEKMSFDLFLQENKNLKCGRLKNTIPIICPHCNFIGYVKGAMKRHHFENCKWRKHED